MQGQRNGFWRGQKNFFCKNIFPQEGFPSNIGWAAAPGYKCHQKICQNLTPCKFLLLMIFSKIFHFCCMNFKDDILRNERFFNPNVAIFCVKIDPIMAFRVPTLRSRYRGSGPVLVRIWNPSFGNYKIIPGIWYLIHHYYSQVCLGMCIFL